MFVCIQFDQTDIEKIYIQSHPKCIWYILCSDGNNDLKIIQYNKSNNNNLTDHNNVGVGDVYVHYICMWMLLKKNSFL